MKNIPVVIPTLNRDVHLKRCIESLQKNSYAKMTDLYIGLDYPPSEKYEEGYLRVNAYLDAGIDGFANVYLYKHTHNLGPSANADFLISKVFEKNDYYIFSEDDNEFSPCFLEYMVKGIERYRNDDSVFAICCSAAPLLKYDNKSEIVKICYFSAHGCATWKEKEELFRRTVNRNYIEDICCSKKKMRKLYLNDARTIAFLASTLLRKETIYQTPDGTIPMIDTTRMIYSCAEDKYIIASVVPLVRNWGFDGSGVNCVVEDDEMSTRYIREEDHFDISNMEPCLCKVNPHMNIKTYILLMSALTRIWLWRIISKHKVHD